MIMEYRTLCVDEINTALFGGFIRRQVVEKCWRREENQWVIRDDPFKMCIRDSLYPDARIC